MSESIHHDQPETPVILAIWETEAVRSQVQGLPGVQSRFKATLVP